MNTATAIENFSLTMNRNFKHSKQDVYDAWTSREALVSWFAPANEFTTVVHELDLSVGGHYKIEMIEPDGKSHTIYGEYVALNPHDQIAFTWEWESDEQNVNSLVTIDFKELNGVTEMTLVHDKLASQEQVEIHSEGWMGCLTQLGTFFK
jgi:uncharacterized protein YndB with AHSA1/START domain